MKLIIDIPEMAYDAYKEWHKNKVATIEQSLIANGIPYEERPQGKCENCDLYFKAMTKEEMKKGEAECILVDELDNMPMISKKHKGDIVPCGTHHQERSDDNEI